MASVRKTLISLLGVSRSQCELIRDWGAQLQAVYDYLDKRDPEFSKRFEDYEKVALSELADGTDVQLKLIDAVIGSLKSGEPLEL